MTQTIEQKPAPALPDLLNAPTGSLRVDDVYALQGYARALDAEVKRAAAEAQRQIDQRIADSHDAARMREIDALVSGGRLLDLAAIAGEFNQRINVVSTSWYGTECARFMAERLIAFAAALLTDGAVRAALNASDVDLHAEDMREGLRAAIRAAGVEPPSPNDRAAENQALADMHDALKTERARADKAERERDVAVSRAECLAHNYRRACDERDQVLASMPTDEQIADWKKVETTLAAIETVIAETSHAAGISGTAEARVRAVASRLIQQTEARVRAVASRLIQQTEAAAKANANARAAIQLGEQARAEADALRAEVAALRGLLSDALPHVHDVARNYGPREAKDVERRIGAALATVPPAKVADLHPDAAAAIAEGERRMREPLAFVRVSEPAGLEPLPVPPIRLDYREDLCRVIARVNELSAIAKRGGL